jgi:hypothetical protein
MMMMIIMAVITTMTMTMQQQQQHLELGDVLLPYRCQAISLLIDLYQYLTQACNIVPDGTCTV